MKIKNKNNLRQAIEVKYLGPTNYKGSRLRAFCHAKSITVGYKSELNSEENHIYAATELLKRLGWDQYNHIFYGQLKNGNFVFVQVPKKEK